MIIFMSEICSKISIFSCFHFRTEYINIHLPCEIFIFYQMWFRWQWCWWLYDCDWFQTLVAESLCWRLFSLFWWFSQCIKSVTNILNRSLTSQSCHQHIWFPTSVTKIDVTVMSGKDANRKKSRSRSYFSILIKISFVKSSIEYVHSIVSFIHIRWIWFWMSLIKTFSFKSVKLLPICTSEMIYCSQTGFQNVFH